MRIDQARIPIRQRDVRDLLDLSLQVLRRGGGKFWGAYLAGAVPFALFNAAVLWPAIQRTTFNDNYWSLYAMIMALLVYLQQPLASAAATLYLGHVMFSEQPTLRQVARDWRQTLGQLILYQGLVRLTIPAIGLAVLTALVRDGREDAPLGFLILLLFYVVPVRAFRPYLSEVILLERNPRSAPAGQMTTARRNAALHDGNSGDLVGRWLARATVGCLLAYSLWLTLWYLRAQLRGESDFGLVMYAVLWPAVLWGVSAYLTIVRFLSYLDLRIRREGWEVELHLRTEVAQFARTPNSPASRGR